MSSFTSFRIKVCKESTLWFFLPPVSHTEYFHISFGRINAPIWCCLVRLSFQTGERYPTLHKARGITAFIAWQWSYENVCDCMEASTTEQKRDEIQPEKRTWSTGWHVRDLCLVLPNATITNKTLQIIRSHKNPSGRTKKIVCTQTCIHKLAEVTRGNVCFAFFSFLAFSFWIAPLYSVFPVVTLTQTKRKWRGDGEDEDVRPVVRTLDVYSVCSVVPCELKHQ